MGFFIILLIFLGIGFLALFSALLAFALFHLSARRQPTLDAAHKPSSFMRLLACVFLGTSLFFGVPLLLWFFGITHP